MTELLQCRGPEFYALARQLTESGIAVRLRLYGQSMYPLLRDGDLVDIVPISPKQVRIGDIVFFRSGRRLLAHRVIKRTVEGRSVRLITQGDSLPTADRPIDDEADLLGRVEIVYRNGRAIRLDRGMIGLIGRLLAGHRWLHRCARLATRGIRRLHRPTEVPR